MHLFPGLGDGLAYIALKLDALDIDVAHEVATLEHEETVVHRGLIVDFHILPFGRKGNLGIGSATPVAQFGVEVAGLSASYGHGHLVCLVCGGHDIGHGQELHVP